MNNVNFCLFVKRCQKSQSFKVKVEQIPSKTLKVKIKQ